MKKAILFLGLILNGLCLVAQVPCNYQTLMNEGIEAARKDKYELALNKFNSARRCDPTKGEVIDAEINKVFAAINQQKVKAEKAEQQAKIEKQVALIAKEKAEKAEVATQIALGQVEKEKQTAITAEKKATAVLDKIYFYDNKFGLAYSKDSSRYGFIDKHLTKKIDFKYEEALSFDYLGFAKVKRDKIYYLIDTLGNEYKLATDENQLDSTITALDLRNKNLETLPLSILKYPNLKILLFSY